MLGVQRLEPKEPAQNDPKLHVQWAFNLATCFSVFGTWDCLKKASPGTSHWKKIHDRESILLEPSKMETCWNL